MVDSLDPLTCDSQPQPEISMFARSKILITGGTGSFGNVVARHFLRTEVEEIRIFSRDEKKQEDMRIALGNDRLKFIIGDVRDYASIHDALSGVDYVFSAAALKQVPSCEFYPLEAVRTNVLGSENVLSACIANGVKKVVVLSTDKAVHPVNAMGMSKGLMEKVMVAKSRTVKPGSIVMSATRYGNVMCSRGSVIPLFIRQAKEGRPITVTDPDMTRFLMSLEEAMNLVFYAFSNAQGGDIFVQKAPACTIYDLARAVRDLFNPNTDIQVIGTRHGEKKHETLLGREEMVRAEDLGDYYRIPPDDRNLNYSAFFTSGETHLSTLGDYTSENTERLDLPRIKERLLALEEVQSELKA
jgi:UDP-N-acetylglucosamine 4,6-dehydratase/5-epimerase